jgi:hypothetical protein
LASLSRRENFAVRNRATLAGVYHDGTASPRRRHGRNARNLVVYPTETGREATSTSPLIVSAALLL